jgi:hypothetical protein
VSGNGLYVALGTYTVPSFPLSYQQPAAYRSTDGINWSGPYIVNGSGFTGISYGNNLFVGVGGQGAIATSPDGINWTAHSSAIFNTFGGVTFGNGIFAADCPGFGVVISPDGTNWISGIGLGGSGAITCGDQGFVAPGSYANYYLVTSPDGTNWTFRGFNGPSSGAAFGNGTYVIVGGQQISQSIPTNAQATPLLSGQVISQGFKLSAIAQPNYSYRIQSSTNLTATNWSNAFAFISTQAVTSFVDTDATNNSSCFYRMKTP